MYVKNKSCISAHIRQHICRYQYICDRSMSANITGSINHFWLWWISQKCWLCTWQKKRDFWYSKARHCKQKHNQKAKYGLKTLNNYRKEHQLSRFSELNLDSDKSLTHFSESQIYKMKRHDQTCYLPLSKIMTSLLYRPQPQSVSNCLYRGSTSPIRTLIYQLHS